MAGSITVEVKGLKELGEALKGLGDEVTLRSSRAATRAAANLVRDAAKSRAPVLTGALKDAIAVRRDTKLSHPGFEIMGVGVFKLTGQNKKAHAGDIAPAFYWKFVEFGTVKMSAKPFLRPALDTHNQGAVTAMEEALTRGINRAVAKAKKTT